MSDHPAPLRSSLLRGGVRHRRVRPEPHDLDYRTWQVLVDVDELPRLDRELTGFGHNRRAPVAIRDTDHLGELDLPLRTKLSRFLAGHGVDLPHGPVLLLATPRVLGRVFNPVAWWFCHDVDGTLRLVVAEVRNTFGDTHPYVLDDLTWTGAHRVEARATKVFHVSPFLPVDGLGYRFVFRPPSSAPGGAREQVAVHMDVTDEQGHLFDATQSHARVPLTTASLWRALLRTPLIVLKTILAIHWEALFIWRRKADFHPRPEPPPTGYDAIDADDLRRPA